MRNLYILFGVCFGLCFPIFSWLLDGLFFHPIAFDMRFLWKIHTINPIHFVIDSAPLILGVAFGVAGNIAHNLNDLKNSLEERVTERTQELQMSKEHLLASEEELRQNMEELSAQRDALQELSETLHKRNDALSTIQNQLQVINQDLETKMMAIDKTVGYMELDTNKKILQVNTKLASWLGYTPDELWNTSHEDLVGEDYAQSTEYTSFWSGLLAGKTFSKEYKRTGKGNKIVWLYASYCPMCDEEGKVTKIIKLAVNITKSVEQTQQILASEEKLKQNLEELQATQDALAKQNTDLVVLHQKERDSNEIFKALFEYSTDAHLLFDDTGIIDCNNAAVKLLGYESKETILALHPAVLSPEYQPDGRTSSEKSIEMDGLAKQKGYHKFEWIHRKADGTDFPVEVILNPIKIKGKDTLLVVWHDLTEIKQNENALKRSYQELKEAQEQLIQAEKLASLGQLVASVAHEINTPLGAIRSSAESTQTILQKILVALPALLHSFSEKELQLFENTLSHLLDDKKILMSSREARLLRNSFAETLEKLQITDARGVADMFVDIGVGEIDAYLPFLQQPKAKEMLPNLFHLVSVFGFTKTMLTATDRAAKIIFALKNFAREDHKDEKVAFNVNDNIEMVLIIYANLLKKGIDVVRDFADLPTFMGYDSELSQVWTNIIHNAIYAMEGKGTLTITTQLQNGSICVSIQDSGHGIPEEAKDKVFNAFFTTKKLGEGTGLGLDIVKKIIDKHHGKIWFESEAGKGTTFFVELPIND